MNEAEDKAGKLKAAIAAGRDRFDKDGDLDLEYVSGVVVPRLQDVLSDRCLEIEKRHRLDESRGDKSILVIHYTGIRAIVSMLQEVSRKERERLHIDQESAGKERGVSLRLYDSVHFNDPDEGNYLVRNLNLPKGYDWMGNSNVSHAYIASFIVPPPDNQRDMSDNLVFWRTYGREGEGCSLKLAVPSSRLRQVLYGAREVERTREILLPIMDVLRPLVSIDAPSIKQSIQERLARAFWGSLEKIQYLYKSEAYAYENECRFVVAKADVREDRICFDYRNEGDSAGRVRHYCEHEALDVGKMFRSDSVVTLGPRLSEPDDLRSVDLRRSLEILKRRAKLDGPAFRNSAIRYRKS